jgi:hypothetical protein
LDGETVLPLLHRSSGRLQGRGVSLGLEHCLGLKNTLSVSFLAGNDGEHSVLLERVLLGKASCCPLRCELRLHGLLPSLGVGGMGGDVEQVEVITVYDIFHLEHVEGEVLSKSNVVHSKRFCEVDIKRSDIAIWDVAKCLPRRHASTMWSLSWLVFGTI